MTSQATIAVLDGSFHIHTRLGGSGRCRVYGATHVSGEEVVVKLIHGEGPFFDELARLYALDDCPYAVGHLHHYPPVSTGGQALPLTGRVDELLQELCPANDPSLGLLVLDYVDGQDFATYLAEADLLAKIDSLMELTYALEAIRSRGVVHGNLDANHVLMDRQTGELRLVGLGEDPDIEATTEIDQAPFRNSFAKDIKAFGDFLELARTPKWRMAKLARACRDPLPERRPSVATITGKLRRLRERNLPRRSLEIWFGFLKPLHVLAWLVFIFSSSMTINWLMGDGELPIAQKRARLLQEEGMLPNERVAQLRQLYREAAEDSEFRMLLAKDLAAYTQQLPVIKFSQKDAHTPIAVLAFKDEPAVIGRGFVARIGDWVELDERTQKPLPYNQVNKRYGYLTQIEFNRIRIDYEDAYSWHYFKKPRLFTGGHLGTEIAVVWHNEDNLDALLEGLATLMSLDYEAKDEDEKLPLGRRVAGIFPSKGGLNAFLDQLQEVLMVDVDDRRLIYRGSRTLFPMYFRFMMVHVRDNKDLAKILESVLAYSVGMDKGLSKLPFEVAFNITWQELLQQANLALSMETDKEGRSTVVIVAAGGA